MTVKEHKPIKVTKKDLEKDLTGTLNSAFEKIDTRITGIGDGLTKSYNDIEKANMRVTSLHNLISKQAARLKALEEEHQDYSISREMGKKLGKFTGAVLNTPMQPINSAHVLSASFCQLFESFKRGFQNARQDCAQAALLRAKAAKERAENEVGSYKPRQAEFIEDVVDFPANG